MSQDYPPPHYPIGGETAPATPVAKPVTLWVALGAGIAAIVGSLLPWISVTAPIVGSRSEAGVSGGAGVLTLLLGAAVTAYAALRLRGQELPSYASMIAAGAGALIFVVGVWKVIDIAQVESDLKDAMPKAGDDAFGLSKAFEFEVSTGFGLGLVLVAGLVAAVAIGLKLVRR